MTSKKEYLLIIAGTAAMAVSINSVFDPLGMVTGGFSGIAILIKELTKQLIPGGMPLGITTAVLNVPLFLIGIKIKGFQFLKRSFVGMISLSVWLSILPQIPIIEGDLMLAALCGGAIQGVGIGLAFSGRGTTGGSDMAAALLQKKFPWYSASQIMQVIDWIIVFFGALVFGFSMVLYAVVAIFVISKVSDGIIEGLKFSKAAFIITEKHQVISQTLMKELKRGTTGITVHGMYSGKEKIMLFCVVPKKQIVYVKEIIHRLDERAFVIVTDAREVLGEGFLRYE